jgi:uncharacterized protein YndB with AHSA1/START domain
MTMATRIGERAVRRSIEINAPAERVWQEFTTQERFRLWYTPEGGVDLPCKDVLYEPRVGGRFYTSGYHEWQGGEQPFSFEGEVLVFDPPRELTVEMKPPNLPTMFLTFLLTEVGSGRTRVEIVQHGFENYGSGAENVRDAFEFGWDMTVPTALRNLVETGKATGR